MTWVTYIEDDEDNLVDVLIFCTELCAGDYSRSHDNLDFMDIPCHEPGSHAYCENCGESVKHGANCYAALTNELTDECPEMHDSGMNAEFTDIVGRNGQ